MPYPRPNPDTVEERKPLLSPATPIPWASLVALCVARLVDPISFTQVFPYANEFMLHLKVTEDPHHVGYYSGAVESIYALTQLFSIYYWAKISDRRGRRPVIILCSLGMALGTLFFGLSERLAVALISRGIAGFFSGHPAVLLSALGEISDSTNVAHTFPIYGFAWPTGVILGPLFGGTLSNPATKFPNLLDFKLFRDFPFFLPCLATAAVGILSAIVGYFFFEESLPAKRRRVREKSTPSHATAYGTIATPSSPTSTTSSIDPPHPRKPLTLRQLLRIRPVFRLFLSGGAISFIATGFDALFSLFCFSPIEKGGLGFPAHSIGIALAIAGGLSAAIQAAILPALLRRFDARDMYKVCMAVWAPAFAALPVLNLIAREGSVKTMDGTVELTEDAMALLWIGIAIVLVISRTGCMCYSLNMILVKQFAPNPESLAGTNGLVQLSMSFFRACAPAVFSGCFAISVKNNLVDGYAYVFVLVAVSYLCYASTRGVEHEQEAQ
ncbi:hypothetical protein BOTBODRAFT_118022 [Botryobasidium botryosum FD-172 SS1]|uniref:Major facilitator superfamily (MFS) profile domain-containing protein n=1 Tax=Botryobasidium botryosum (strain FD-172 SS1) TaxID=930990 RepID=A0A067LZH8_BOTB1|nr:hypothetical protein BOTBODRAFT_118022 [Botryobasidium botryosum FD-172 SS1]